MKEISELIVVILEQLSPRRKEACLKWLTSEIERKIAKLNGKSGERNNIIREKANSLILPINVTYGRILD